MNQQILLVLSLAGITLALIGGGIAITAHYQDIQVTQDHTHTSFSSDKDLVSWINTNFVSEAEWAHHNKILNATFDAIETDLDSAGLAINTIQNKFIIIEHQNIIPTTTPDSLAKCAGDFNLKTLKITGEEEDRYAPTEAVFIRGDFDAGVSGDYKILKGTVIKKQSSTTTASDGSFLGTFNAQLDQPTGQYTAEFSFGGMKDCITFYIE